MLSGYLSLDLTVIGRIRNIGHQVLQFPWQTGNSSSPTYFHIFFFIALFDEAFIADIKITLYINPLNAELNPICYFLALLGAHHFLHVSRIRVKSLTLRLLMLYIYIYIYIYIWSTYS
jgi:hypothetical protein